MKVKIRWRGPVGHQHEDNEVGLMDEHGRLIVPVRPGDLTEKMRHRLMLHGLKQKLGDAAAGAKTDEEREDRIRRMAEALKSDRWHLARERGLTIEQEAWEAVRDDADPEEFHDLTDLQKRTVKKTKEWKRAVLQVKLDRLED